VKVILIETVLDIAIPESCSTDLTALTDKEIARLQREPGNFVGIEVHAIERREIKPTP